MELLEEIERELAERSFKDYINFVFSKVYRRPFFHNWHHDVLIEVLENVYAGKIKNVVINIPPRYSKTELVVILFSSWVFAKNPRANFIHVSYSDSLALKNSNAVKNIILSDSYLKFWGLSLHKSEQAKGRWSLEEGGTFYATSSEGRVTGEGAGVKGRIDSFNGALIIDDPIKSGQERYDLALSKVIDNFENVLSSRINNPGHDPIILIMQRQHENDLSGYLVESKSLLGDFEHIRIEALKEHNETEYKEHPIVKKYDKRKIGESLWKQTHSSKDLEIMKSKNPVLFAGQYQQRPSPMEGNIIKREYLRFYSELPEKLQYRLYSLDLNFKEEGTSNACISFYGVKLPDVYLIGQVVGRWSFPDAVKVFKRFVRKCPQYNGVLIEDKANGPAMISTLRQEGFIGVIPVKVDKSKIYRLSEVSLFYQAGNVYYPEVSKFSWVNDHVDEILKFPNAKNDDRVDAETQALKYIQEKLSPAKFYDY